MRPHILPTAAVLLALACAPAAVRRQVVVPPGVTTLASYSPGVLAGGLLFLSGAIGVPPGGRELVSGGAGPETSQALANIGAVLAAAGAGYDDVVKCTVFLADIADYAVMNDAYGRVFARDPPARSTVAVAALPLGAQVEVECVARVSN